MEQEATGYSTHRKRYLRDRIQGIKPYVDMDPATIAAARSDTYEQPIFTEKGKWVLPAGAYQKDQSGPT